MINLSTESTRLSDHIFVAKNIALKIINEKAGVVPYPHLRGLPLGDITNESKLSGLINRHRFIECVNHIESYMSISMIDLWRYEFCNMTVIDLMREVNIRQAKITQAKYEMAFNWIYNEGIVAVDNKPREAILKRIFRKAKEQKPRLNLIEKSLCQM